MKTSASHPLQIAAIVAGVPGLGRVGLTLCPGKYDPYAMSGAWDRDLALDLDNIRDWGAAAIVIGQNRESHLGGKCFGQEVCRPHYVSWRSIPSSCLVKKFSDA